MPGMLKFTEPLVDLERSRVEKDVYLVAHLNKYSNIILKLCCIGLLRPHRYNIEKTDLLSLIPALHIIYSYGVGFKSTIPDITPSQSFRVFYRAGKNIM